MRLLLRQARFLPAILGALFVASLMLLPGTAYASALQSHSPQKALIGNQNDCTATEVYDVVIATDYGWDIDCFQGEGTEPVSLYNVSALETGSYYLTFTWLDYNRGSHTTSEGSQWKFLSAGNAAANGFGGYSNIYEITSITMYAAEYAGLFSCPQSAGLAVWMATNVPGDSTYYADCFSAKGTHSVGLYGVYAIETGFYYLTFTWKDYNGASHTSTKPPGTFLAAGNAAANGFGGSNRIAEITSITLST